MTAIRERRNAFVGRSDDVRAVIELISARRLVTITGAGGVGKTRLATRVVNLHADATGRQARAVSLAGLREPERVALVVMRALGLADIPGASPRDVIVAAWEGQDVIVLLDNGEHLIEAVSDLVDDLLDALPGLRVLVTSRRALEVDGERVYALAPLGTDAEGAGVPDAVSLLIERARDADSRFDISPEDLPAAKKLCGALDGLPLAIELAAARLRTLSVAELAQGLGSRFALPPGNRTIVARHRTLRAVVDWSYELCTPAERRVWASLSVFSGSFSTAAAIAVSRDEELDESQAWEAIDGLIAQSLLERSEPGRHRMLETIREYGRERARASGAWDGSRRRHLHHFCEIAGEHRRTFHGPGQAQALATLRDDAGELQSALTFAASGDSSAAAGAQLVSDLRFHWAVGGLLREGRAWTERALTWRTEPLRHAELRALAAWLALVQGDLDAADAHLDETERVLRERGGDTAAAVSVEVKRWRGSHALFRGDLARARDEFTGSIAAARALGDETATLMAAFQLTVAGAYDRAPDATAPARTALRVAGDLGESWMRAHALWSLSVAEVIAGRHSDARGLVREALAIERSFRDPLGACLMLETWAAIASSEARHDSAAVVFAALGTGWRRVGSDVSAFGPHLGAQHAAAVARTRSALDSRRLAAAGARGQRLDLAEAIVFALDSELASSALSTREREVADGIHQGLSNRDIATELVLSVRTVETHVQHIFAKLGVSSRSQIPAWVERGSVRDDP